MEELKVAALEIVKKHGKQMAIELVAVAAIPALEAAVKKSATPIDDVVVAALKEPLKEALIKLIEEV
jgi:hypothetical protein